MSDDLFPKLPGLKWGTVKAPIFSTAVLTAASGRSTRGSFQSYPQWKITASGAPSARSTSSTMSSLASPFECT